MQLKDYQTNFNERERVSAKIVNTIPTKGKTKDIALQRKEHPAHEEKEIFPICTS